MSVRSDLFGEGGWLMRREVSDLLAKKVTLALRSLSVAVEVPFLKGMAPEGVSAESVLDMISGAIVSRFSAHIYGVTKPVSITATATSRTVVRVPATWWDMLKWELLVESMAAQRLLNSRHKKQYTRALHKVPLSMRYYRNVATVKQTETAEACAMFPDIPVSRERPMTVLFLDKNVKAPDESTISSHEKGVRSSVGEEFESPAQQEVGDTFRTTVEGARTQQAAFFVDDPEDPSACSECGRVKAYEDEDCEHCADEKECDCGMCNS